jgi:fructosamine-3-kinase
MVYQSSFLAISILSFSNHPFYCSTPQINTWTADWIEFYSKHRLGFQLELITQRFGDSAIYDKGAWGKDNI